MNEKINYVEFAAKDLASTKQFFKDAFGWQFQDYGEEYMAFSESGLMGGFYQADLCTKADNGGALIVLYSDDIQETEKAVCEAGGHIVKSLFEFPGGCRFHFTEPSGNELAVWSDKVP